MSALSSVHLLEQAERLVSRPPAGPARQVDVRRAISSAYHAVFHHVAKALADELVGVTLSAAPRYVLVYRSVSHAGLHDLCTALAKPVLPRRCGRF